MSVNVVFETENLTVSSAKLMSELFPKLCPQFDGSPFVMPSLPRDAPAEIPLIQFSSLDRSLAFSIARSRTSYMMETNPHKQELGDVLNKACQALLTFKEVANCHVKRIGVVVVNVAKQPNPAALLARHFCKNEILKSPLNRPQNFELHAHKIYPIENSFQVNSWVRCKAIASNSEPLVRIEQDINTVQSNTSDFQDDQISNFFQLLPDEVNGIKLKYFPGD